MLVLAFLLTGSSINVFGHTFSFEVFNRGTLPGVLCIAPCLIFCCIMSAYRGYYEGLRNMTPTAISQVLEALGKLVFGYGLSFIILKTSGNYSYAAAGALLGITLGTVVAALYLELKYRLTGKSTFTEEQLNSAEDPYSSKKTAKILIAVAIPIVLGSLVNNVSSLIDVAMVQSQLARAIEKSPEYFYNTYSALIASETADALKNGQTFIWEKDLPNALYGVHRGFAFSIYNLVPSLTSVLGVSAIPVLASAWTKRDREDIKSNVNTMIRTTALVAVPAGFGIIAMSGQILDLLYSNENIIAIATINLRILGICAIFAGLNGPLTNMLQAIGRQGIPLRNIAVGAVLKIVINFVLVGTPEINIVGVPIGTVVCYAYICIANFICFVKYSGVVPNLLLAVGKPLVCGAICGFSAFIFNFLLALIGITGSLATLVSIVFAALVYAVMLFLLRAITKNDIISMPKGKKLLKVLEKFGLMR
jgi:stage V sporulation protein B